MTFWVINVISSVRGALPVCPRLRTYRCVAANDVKGHQQTCFDLTAALSHARERYNRSVKDHPIAAFLLSAIKRTIGLAYKLG